MPAVTKDVRALILGKDDAMARYFFNIRNGADIPDTVGSEHPDLASVREEALQATAELIKGRLLANSDADAWIVQVTDDTGFTVMVLSLSASIHVTPRIPELIAA
jgi:hypothetical protein